MGKKHKHEEHENHERWVISYADMVTLLFALFVVLYALGEVKLRKLKDLKKSLAFAFHFEGAGKTYQDGIHERGDVGGDLLEGAMILNPQKGDLKEFLVEALPSEFEEITGKSLDIVLSDDTIAFSGPLSAFFPRNSNRLRQDVHPWLTTLVENAHAAASQVRIRIEAPQLRIGRLPNGSPYYTQALCNDRGEYLHQMVSLMGNVAVRHITYEFKYVEARATVDSWEDVGTIAFAFSNPNG